jgi:hypothetical protein
MHALPMRLTLPLRINRTFTRFMAYNTYNLRSPLLITQPLYSLFFYCPGKLNQLRVKLLALFCSAFKIIGNLFTKSTPSLRNIARQLPANGTRMNSNLFVFPLLLHSCFNKCLNLTPFCQTKLIEIIKHSNQKVALSGQKIKSHQKYFLSIV